jgi:fucose 4-O-acetylase-like acetyltransferase
MVALVSLRYRDIERAKGLAILFVVFGHIVARADPLGVAWYEPARRAVYSFHMPFFLYLSGMVAVLSGAVFVPPVRWLHLMRARAQRLLVPFFALGILVVFGKAFAEHFLFVDNQPASLAAGMLNLLWHTGNSPAISIWYLFVLFTLTVTAPLLVWLDRSRLRVLFIVCLVIYFLPLPQYFYLDHIGKYAVFFASGALAASGGEKWSKFVDRVWSYFLMLFLCCLSLVACFGATWPEKLDLLPIGILSMPALHGLVRHKALPFASVLLWLGQNSFMIYLFNTIFIGVAKGLLLHVTNWDGGHFLPFAALLMISGSLGPVLLKKTVIQRVKLIDRYTG